MTSQMHNFRLKIYQSVKLTSHADTCHGLQTSHRKYIKYAAVAALIIETHLLDGDVAAVCLRNGELHAGFLMADRHRVVLPIRQQELFVRVIPTHLTDSAVCFYGDVAAKQQRGTNN